MCMKPRDDTLKIDFSNFVLLKISEDDVWIQRVLCTNKEQFTVSVNVNEHNCRIWRLSNQYGKREKPLHSDYVFLYGMQ